MKDGVKWAAIGLAVTAVTLLSLILSGAFDPKPIGRPVWAAEPGQITIPAGERKTVWLRPLPQTAFSVRLTAVYQSGSPDSATGLILGSDQQNSRITISPLGYAAVTSPCHPVTLSPCHPFPSAPFPHVRSGANPNEIWIDVANGRMTVRINRELLWSGNVGELQGELGVWGESYGDTAVYHLPQIILYEELNRPQGGATSNENSSQYPVSLRSPPLCGLFSGQSTEKTNRRGAKGEN